MKEVVGAERAENNSVLSSEMLAKVREHEVCQFSNIVPSLKKHPLVQK